ncbi:MAG: holo-ACP synthase [Pontimonas sp.]
MVIGVGVDVVDLERFARSMTRTPQLGERLFGESDHHGIPEGDARIQSLAARFAAKEAALKALGGDVPGFSWHDIQVTKSDSGAPSLVVSGGVAERAQQKGVTSWHLSISHDGPVAVAFVIAESESVS